MNDLFCYLLEDLLAYKCIFFKRLLLLWPGQRCTFVSGWNCFLIKITNRYQQIFPTNRWWMMPLATNIQQCYCSDYFPHSWRDDGGNETTASGGYTEKVGPVREEWLIGKCHNASCCG